MDYYLLLAIFLNFIISLMLGLVHLSLWVRTESKFLQIWTIAWFFYSVRFIFELMMAGGATNPWFRVAVDTSMAISGILLYLGVTFLGQVPLGKRLDLAWIIPIAVCGWSIVYNFHLQVPSLASGPGFLVVGFVQLLIGYHFFQGALSDYKTSKMLGVSMFFWGILKISYPFTRHIPDFATLGFSFSTLLATSTAVLMVMLILEKLGQERDISAQRYKVLLESVNDIILLVEQDGRIIDANRRALETYGYSYQELTNMTVFDLRELAASEIIKTQLAMANDHGTLFETRHYRKDGSYLDVEVSSVGVNLGEERVLISIIRDVTDRKKAEELIKQSRDFYLSLFEGFPTLIWRSDTKGNCNYVNQSWSEFTGRTRDEALNSQWLEVVHPQDRDRLHQTFRTALAEKKPFEIRYRLMRYDGQYRWVIDSGRPYYELDGSFGGFIGSIQDINTELEYQGKLQETKERLQVTLESIGDGVIATDLSGEITLMNKVAQELTGWTQEEAMGLPVHKVFNIVSEETGEPLRTPVEQVLEKRRVVGLANHSMLISKDGDTRYIADSAAPIMDNQGNLQGVVMVFRDVTSKRQSQKLLEESEERYRATFENTGTAMLIVEDDMTVSLANRQTEILTGYSRAEIEGKMTWPHFVSAKDRERMKEYHRLRRLKGDAGAPREYEFTLVDRAGREKEVLCTVRVIPGTKQSVASWMDITVRKQAEERIRFLSFHDKITGLYNRAYFEEELQRLDHQRQLPLSIILGDVNGLKLINDAFGHKAGDELLQNIANILRNCCRKEDIVARWGGDEFIILLPRTDSVIARKVAERVRRACAGAEEIVESVKLSISLGVATKKQSNEEIRNIIQLAEERMYRQKLMEATSFRNSLVLSLEESLRERDYETEEHAERLHQYTQAIGRKLGLSENQLDELALLAALHDIGKLAIPDGILMKPGPLEDEEWEIMKRHSEIGYRIASSSPDLAPIAESILAHHERYDGTGYPRGLKAREIPLIARILSVVDSFDVMTHNRPYKEAMTHQEAVRELRRCSGTQFDPEIVAVFLEILEKNLGQNEAAASKSE